jgi:hypothetical protein
MSVFLIYIKEAPLRNSPILRLNIVNCLRLKIGLLHLQSNLRALGRR